MKSSISNLKIPNCKHQITSKFQNSIFKHLKKHLTRFEYWGFKHWNLFVTCLLIIGISNFYTSLSFHFPFLKNK